MRACDLNELRAHCQPYNCSSPFLVMPSQHTSVAGGPVFSPAQPTWSFSIIPSFLHEHEVFAFATDGQNSFSSLEYPGRVPTNSFSEYFFHVDLVISA